MVNKLAKTFYALICFALIVQLSGCGTIFYPSRRGQRGGRIDAGVAVLDGVGLLFFIIPGVIAFAVDFADGTIYLPGSSRSSLGLSNMRYVKFDAGNIDNNKLENIIKKETGRDIKLSQAEVSKLRSKEEMQINLAKALNKDSN